MDNSIIWLSLTKIVNLVENIAEFCKTETKASKTLIPSLLFIRISLVSLAHEYNFPCIFIGYVSLYYDKDSTFFFVWTWTFNGILLLKMVKAIDTQPKTRYNLSIKHMKQAVLQKLFRFFLIMKYILNWFWKFDLFLWQSHLTQNGNFSRWIITTSSGKTWEALNVDCLSDFFPKTWKRSQCLSLHFSAVSNPNLTQEFRLMHLDWDFLL